MKKKIKCVLNKMALAKAIAIAILRVQLIHTMQQFTVHDLHVTPKNVINLRQK